MTLRCSRNEVGVDEVVALEQERHRIGLGDRMRQAVAENRLAGWPLPLPERRKAAAPASNMAASKATM